MKKETAKKINIVMCVMLFVGVILCVALPFIAFRVCLPQISTGIENLPEDERVGMAFAIIIFAMLSWFLSAVVPIVNAIFNLIFGCILINEIKKGNPTKKFGIVMAVLVIFDLINIFATYFTATGFGVTTFYFIYPIFVYFIVLAIFKLIYPFIIKHTVI